MDYILSYNAIWLILIFWVGMVAVFSFSFVHFFQKQKKAFDTLKYNFENLNLQQNTYNKQFIANILAQNCPNSYTTTALTHLHQLSKHENIIDWNFFLQYTSKNTLPYPLTLLLKNSTTLVLIIGIISTTAKVITWTQDNHQLNENTATDITNNSLNITQLFLLSNAAPPILVAIIAATTLLILQKIYFSIQKNHIQQINLFFAQNLLPLFNPPTQHVYFANLVNQVANNSQLINTAALRFEQVSKQLATDLQILTQYALQSKNNIEGYIKYQEMLHTDINALTQIVSGFKFQIDNSSSENQQIAQNLLKHNTTLEKINQRIQETQFEVGDWLKQIISVAQNQQTDFAENLKKLLEMTRSNLIGTQSIINRFGNNIQKFETSIEHLQNHLNYFNSAIQTTSQVQVEKLTELQNRLDAIAKSLNQLNQALPTQVQQMSAAVEHTINLANPEYVKQMIDALANKRIQERLEFFQNHIDDLQTELEKQKNKTQTKTNSDEQANITTSLKKGWQFIKDANKK